MFSVSSRVVHAGFTLIDTLMAASIMALVLLGVFSLLRSGVADSRILERAREIDQVLLAGRSCMLSYPPPLTIAQT